MPRIKFAAAAVVLTLLGASHAGNGQTPARFEFLTAPGSVYSVRVWETTLTTQAGIAARLDRQPRAASSAGGVVLVCRPGTAVVEITRFASVEMAERFAASAIAGAPAASESRVLRVVNSSRQAGATAVTVVTRESFVQWSEYVMRPNANIEELQEMTTSMTATMAEGGAEPTLDSIVQLRAIDDAVIGLFGIWRTTRGFEVFADNQTWGEQGYWVPYAENEHWMCAVSSIR